MLKSPDHRGLNTKKSLIYHKNLSWALLDFYVKNPELHEFFDAIAIKHFT